MDDRISFSDIKAELLAQLPRLCLELLGGKKNGDYWLASSPGQNNKTPNLWVRMDSGAWRDEPVASGDIIMLPEYVLGLKTRKDTFSWCLAWLGWDNGQVDRKALEVSRIQAVKKQEQQDIQAQSDMLKNRNSALSWFIKAEKDWRGTPLENYLMGARGIDFKTLGRLPGCIRYIPNAKHVDLDGVVTFWPLMLTAIHRVINDKVVLVAVHRTWLKHDGSGKAPVKPNKKIWPAGWGGGVIRLWKGRPQYSPEQAVKRGKIGPVIIPEGIETGFSLANAKPEIRVWAAATMGNMALIDDHDCVSGWILAHDPLKKSLNEKQRAAHLKKLEQIKQHFLATGKPVSEIWPAGGMDGDGDFNDMIMR